MEDDAQRELEARQQRRREDVLVFQHQLAHASVAPLDEPGDLDDVELRIEIEGIRDSGAAKDAGAKPEEKKDDAGQK